MYNYGLEIWYDLAYEKTKIQELILSKIEKGYSPEYITYLHRMWTLMWLDINITEEKIYGLIDSTIRNNDSRSTDIYPFIPLENILKWYDLSKSLWYTFTADQKHTYTMYFFSQLKTYITSTLYPKRLDSIELSATLIKKVYACIFGINDKLYTDQDPTTNNQSLTSIQQSSPEAQQLSQEVEALLLALKWLTNQTVSTEIEDLLESIGYKTIQKN
jgi:hypothetical protein